MIKAYINKKTITTIDLDCNIKENLWIEIGNDGEIKYELPSEFLDENYNSTGQYVGYLVRELLRSFSTILRTRDQNV